MPGLISRLIPFNAIKGPNHFDTFLTSTMGDAEIDTEGSRFIIGVEGNEAGKKLPLLKKGK